MIEAVALEEAAAAATASTCFASDGPRLTLSFRGSSGGHLQSSAPFERTLQLWDWASRRRVRSMPELVSDATYLSVATSTDGSLLATGAPTARFKSTTPSRPRSCILSRSTSCNLRRLLRFRCSCMDGR